MGSVSQADEARLDEWVAAKRAKDFGEADKIREDLRTRGIDPDKARPRDQNAAVEAQLDQWVAAKRARDFDTADRIRDSLRALGIDPDKARPALGAPAPQMVPAAQYIPVFQQPAVVPMYQPVVAAGSTRQRHDTETEVTLDEWVAAKRAKDFNRADLIRDELRAKGVRPADRLVQQRGRVAT